MLALGFLGMTIGTPIGGILGDRIGRKPTLVLSVMLFGVATAAIALANGILELSIYRTLGGVGMGGAIPAATTLIAEMTPARRRSLAVTLGLICIPIGGLAGGLIAAQLLPVYGWRSLFLVGGGAPFLVSFILMAVLPESVQFLARKSGNADEVTRRLREIGCDVPAGANFIDTSATKAERPSSSPHSFIMPGMAKPRIWLSKPSRMMASAHSARAIFCLPLQPAASIAPTIL